MGPLCLIVVATCTRACPGVGPRRRRSWKTHIQNITSSAAKALGVLRRRFSKCSVNSKKLLFNATVKPIVEYASTVWDPHTQTDKKSLETIQNRGARYISGDYSHFSSVPSIKERVGIRSLEYTRRRKRLIVFHKINNNLHGAKISLPPKQTRKNTRGTNTHKNVYTVPLSNVNVDRYSYVNKTLREWNCLPAAMAETSDPEEFSRLYDVHFPPLPTGPGRGDIVR